MSVHGASPVKSTTQRTITMSVDPPALHHETILEKEIPSDGALVAPLTLRTVHFLLKEELIEPALEEKMQICLTEALRNAVFHGNREEFSKKVRLRVFLDHQEWGIVIADEGRGFDPALLPNPAAEESLWAESGRGILMMMHYMDRVEYFSGGRVLFLAKRR